MGFLATTVLADKPPPHAGVDISAEQSSSGEITQTLRRIQRDIHLNLSTTPAGTGTWRRVEITREPGCLTTNTIYTWRAPDGNLLWRREQTLYYPTTSKVLHLVQVTNAQGGWALHRRVAILYPPSPTLKTVDTNTVFERKVPLQLPNVSVERHAENGHTPLCFVEECSDKTRNSSELRAKALRKEYPLLFRPFIPNSFLKMAAEHMIPVRRETQIEEETGALILLRVYAADGVIVWEQSPWERCPDLSPDSYLIPPGVRQIRPKTADEANHLDSEAREEEKHPSR